MKARALQARVVHLSQVRADRRLFSYQERLEKVLASNKRAVGRLYTSGILFTKEGTRAGRELLLAHEHLLRVTRLLERLGNTGDVPAPRKASHVEAVFDELDLLLERTQELTERTSEVLELLKR